MNVQRLESSNKNNNTNYELNKKSLKSLRKCQIILIIYISMILSLLKGFDMVAMFSLVYIFGSIPIKSVLFKENRYPIEMACIQHIFKFYSEAFSGGLYISFAVIHLIPESAQSMDVLFQNKNHHFPISYLLVVLSFMLIMWV